MSHNLRDHEPVIHNDGRRGVARTVTRRKSGRLVVRVQWDDRALPAEDVPIEELRRADGRSAA